MEKKYLSLKEAAEKWGIGARRINALCLEQRIPGAFKIGNSWDVPIDAKKQRMHVLRLENMSK